MKGLATIDIIVFLFYFIIVAGYGYWIYLKKKKTTTDTKDFFLAEGSLTWWAIGASLIASNISAEQFIGMSGEGFFVGTAVAAYEWIAALALIIIAIWFIFCFERQPRQWLSCLLFRAHCCPIGVRARVCLIPSTPDQWPQRHLIPASVYRQCCQMPDLER